MADTLDAGNPGRHQAEGRKDIRVAVGVVAQLPPVDGVQRQSVEVAAVVRRRSGTGKV